MPQRPPPRRCRARIRQRLGPQVGRDIPRQRRARHQQRRPVVFQKRFGGHRFGGMLRSIPMNVQKPRSGDRKDCSQSGHDARQHIQCAIDLVIRRVTRKAEADRAVSDFRIDPHRPQNVRRFQAAAAARGPGTGADVLLAEQQQNRLGFQAGKADVGRVGEARVGGTVDVRIGDARQDLALEPVAQGATCESFRGSAFRASSAATPCRRCPRRSPSPRAGRAPADRRSAADETGARGE